MPANVADALTFIIGSIAQLFVFVLILRFLLPWFRADFRNPLAQAILKITSPLVVPLRRIVPPIGRVDTATILVTFIVLYLTVLVITRILQAPAGFPEIAISSLVYMPLLTLRLYMFLIIVRIILSWVAQGGYNPAIAVIYTLTDPVLRPFQRIIPRLGTFDISPIFAIIIVGALIRVVVGFLPLPVM